MKPTKKHPLKPEQSSHDPARSPKDTGARPEPSKVSRRRLWLFRVCGIFLVPLVLIGGLELALRVAGYGYPTSFFLRSQIADHPFFVTNEKFAFRFFPRALARTPLPLRMPAQKLAHSYRIFLLGESAAQGDPDPSFGVGRYLEVLLRERYPGTEFQVVCVAMTAINSHAILPIAKECAGHDGDLWIVYMGNNEIVGPFGAGTVFGRQAPSRTTARLVLATRTTRIGQLMTLLAGRLNHDSSAPKTWSGMNMFKENRLRYDAASRLRTYDNFRGNLQDILRTAKNAGVPVLLSTVASNLKDCAPFASLHSQDLTAARQSEWENFYTTGGVLEAAGNFQEALEPYLKAAAIDPQFAELQFRIGRCHLALTNAALARQDFELARDYDALGFRADDRINKIIKETAGDQAGKNIHLLDAADILARGSTDGIPGQDLFYEHVHLTFAGNYLLARGFAEEVARLLPAPIVAQQRGPWASADFCDRHLGVTPWDRYRLWQMNFSRVSEPPFTDQLNDVPRAKMYMATMQELKATMSPATRTAAVANFEAALSAAPEDDMLHGNYAQFLDETGDLPHAIREQKRVCELLPGFPAAFSKVGLLLVRQGDAAAAADYFSKALVLRDDYVPALNELGLVRLYQGRTEEAVACFSKALALNPGYVETYFNLGFLEQSQGHLETALARYREAAKLQPNGPAAFFSQAVHRAAQHQRGEAINLFRTAVWMYPAFWQARYLLGVELATSEKVEEAQAQFSEVVRCRPDFARAHLNLGVAFGKQGKLDEALKEFQLTLQLSPTNKSARQYLEETQAMKARRPSP